MAYVIGSWYGPVSISVPVVMISKLLFNMIIVGAVLKLEHFDKNQRVGTYVIAFAIVALPEVGPQPIAEQKDPIALIQVRVQSYPRFERSLFLFSRVLRQCLCFLAHCTHAHSR